MKIIKIKNNNYKNVNLVFLQTSLHLTELSPDSRYELTINLANRKLQF